MSERLATERRVWYIKLSLLGRYSAANLGGATVPLHLAGRRTVAIGPFNEYIITPSWLREVGIVQDGTSQIDEGGINEALVFATPGVDWQVGDHALIIDSASRDCGHYLAEVVRQLPHTPIHSVSHEFTFTAKQTEWDGSPLPKLGEQEPQAFTGENGYCFRWTGLFAREDATRVELTVEAILPEAAVVVGVNYHRRVLGKAPEAIRAAEQFGDDGLDAARLIREVLRQEILGYS